jgi:hypothetical protein
VASPNTTYSELVTTTLRNRTGKLADNYTNQRALLMIMKKKGKVRPFSGGRVLVEELFYQSNATASFYSGFDQLNITPADVISAAEYDIKQASVSVSMSGLEELQNAGKEQVIDLLESRITNAEESLMDLIGTAIYSDGTAYGGKQIAGLQHLISAAPSSGVVGGIDRGTWTFWRNKARSCTSDGGAAATAANITSNMNRLWVQLVKGSSSPDVISADNNFYTLYWESLQSIQRIGNSELADAGFDNVKYKGADVVLDGGIRGAMPTSKMYFINTKHVFFRPHSARNFVVLGGERQSVNQDAFVKIIGFAGAMTMNCAENQGVLAA